MKNTTVGGFSFVIISKQTDSDFLCIGSLICILFFYEQNFINYIDTMLGFSIFKDFSSLEGYRCEFFNRILYVPSPPILSVTFKLFLISSYLLCISRDQPHELSPSMVSWYWRYLSNSSLMTNLLSSFRIHYKWQCFCEIFPHSIR